MGKITSDLEAVYIRQRMGKAGNHHPHQPEEFLQRFQLSAGQQSEKNPLRETVKILRDFRLPPPCTRKLRSSGMLHSVGFHVSGQLNWISLGVKLLPATYRSMLHDIPE
jgi:uncharacterized protein (DUF2236 family)